MYNLKGPLGNTFQITLQTLPLMDNDSLSRYLPLEGDRLLARSFGKVSLPNSPTEPIGVVSTPYPVSLSNSQESQPTRIISVKRGDALTGMIEAFCTEQIVNENIQVSMLLPNGKKEKGEGTGVLVDCITEFWEGFYDQCTVGTLEKVPCLRHDYREKEWQAVGRVLLYGWRRFQFLPIQLSKSYMMAVFGLTPNNEQLTSSFKKSFPFKLCVQLLHHDDGNRVVCWSGF